MIGASRRVEQDLRKRLFRHLESLDSGYFTEFHTGDLMSRFTSDVDAVRMAIGPGIMYSVNTVFTLGLALTVMLMVSVSLTIYSMVPLVLLTVVIRVLGPRIHQESMLAQERLADISVLAQENFSNTRVVRAFVCENSEVERMRKLSDNYFDQNMKLAKLRAFTNALLWLCADRVILLLVALGGSQLIQGQIQLGEFAAFKGCQLLLIWPMVALGWVMTIFQRGAASAQRIRDILDARPRVDDSRAEPDTRVREGSIQFSRVHFEYIPGKPVLHDLDFRLAAGETLGVVGPTGCGKTTLLHLIPRLYPASGGEIRIDGVPLEQIPLTELRRCIGFVPQEPFLFSTTIEENIAFGIRDATPEMIREVAQVVRIHDEVMTFPHGYQERVGERGITLSGGQKQRIALARALLGRPRMVILDDVLSAVDAHTENEILSNMRQWTENLTTIIVSHRLSTVRHAQQILVLIDGTIVQRGTHEELLAQSGYYAELNRKQSLEDELEHL